MSPLKSAFFLNNFYVSFQNKSVNFFFLNTEQKQLNGRVLFIVFILAYLKNIYSFVLSSCFIPESFILTYGCSRSLALFSAHRRICS